MTAHHLQFTPPALKARPTNHTISKASHHQPEQGSIPITVAITKSFRLYQHSRLRGCNDEANEELRTRSETNLHRLFVEATGPENSSTNAKLAKKALRYRNILSHIEGVVDAQDPVFNASQVLGLTWMKDQPAE